MEQALLTRISLVCSVVGLIALGLISSSITSNTILIQTVTPDSIGLMVKLCGVITRAYTSKDGHVFLDLADESGTINVVVFESMVNGLSINPYELKEGDNVCVRGEVDMYRNELEIVPKDITKTEGQPPGI